jgi:glutathione S-transferase
MKGIIAMDISGFKYNTYPGEIGKYTIHVTAPNKNSVDMMKLKKTLAPPHQVPVLCYGTDVIPDTTDIMKYLDTKV